MRVAVAVGRYVPGECGVEDFAARLNEALRLCNVEAHILEGRAWTVMSALADSRAIAAAAPDVLHIHYPTIGFGHRPAPQIVAALQRVRSMRIPIVLTLHEFSRARALRKAALLPFGLVADHIVFTSRMEQLACARIYPWVPGKSSVIPIGSNIPVATEPGPRDPNLVAYFGSIAPGKGLEAFIELARLAHACPDDPWRFQVVGSPVPDARAFWEAMRRDAASLPITWHAGRAADEVAALLARAAYAYLPYPDGASERRTTLLAALSNGAAVISTAGPHTTPEIERAICVASDPSQALQALDGLRADAQRRSNLVARGAAYAAAFSWHHIAERYSALYARLAGGGA